MTTNTCNIELPKDAEGREIPLDTGVLYDKDGVGHEVDEWTYVRPLDDIPFWYASNNAAHYFAGDYYLTPPDTWEKLEEDAKKRACDYADAPRGEDGFVMCDGCRFHEPKECYLEMALDVLARAKKLAGVEEQEGE